MRLAHRARPGPQHLARVDVAPVQNLERVEELAAKERRASGVPGESGKRRDGRTHAAEAAEVGLDAPDRDDRLRRHAILLANLVEQRTVADSHLPSRSDDPRRQTARDVRFQRQHGLGLGAVALDYHPERFVDVLQRGIDDVPANAARERLTADLGQPVGERGPGFILGGGRTDRRPRQEEDRQCDHDAAMHTCSVQLFAATATGRRMTQQLPSGIVII